MCTGQRQIVHGPRNAHIHQSALFLHRIAVIGIDRQIPGEQAVLQAGNIDLRELKALRAVQRHQKNPVLIPVHLVDVRHQRDVRQKTRQQRRISRLLRKIRQLLRLFLIGDNFADQLVNIGQPVIRVFFLGIPQIFLIAGLSDDALHQIFEARPFFQFSPEGPDQLDKRPDFAQCRVREDAGHRSVAELFQRLEKAEISAHDSIVRNLLHRRGADAAARNIQDPAHSQIVPAVVDHFEVGEHIFDFSALIEIGAAHHIVGNRAHDQAFFQKTRLRVGPVQHREIPIIQRGLQVFLPLDVLRNKGRLLHRRVELAQVNPASLLLSRPQGLGFPVPVVVDDRVGCVQHHLRRPVVLFQLHHKSVRIDFFKIKNIPDIGSPELIDRLIVVAYDAQIASAGLLRPGQQPDQLELSRIGVLVLVDHNIAEPVLIVTQNVLPRVEQLHRFHQQIVKIQRVVLVQQPLIFLVRLADLLLHEVVLMRLLIAPRRQQLILRGGNCGENRPLPQLLRIDPQIPAHLLHQRLLVIRVIDGEVRLVADLLDVPPQDPDAHGVKGRNPDGFRPETDQFVNPLAHLLRGFVCEGDCEDVPRIHAALIHQIGNSVGDDPRFARAGAGQNQHRSLRVLDGLPLLCI